MDHWAFALLLMFGGVVAFIILGLPVALAFFTANIIGALVFLGGEAGLMQVVRNLRPAIGQYSLVPIALFVLMGEVMLKTGMAARSIEAVDKLISRVPGRLSVVAVLGGTGFASLSGSSVANAAVVGRTLLPQMKERGYCPKISIGPVAAVGGIAALIPPSALAVMLASLAQISVKELLISGIVPGLMIMFSFLLYILVRCKINPSLAPSYEIELPPLHERVLPFIRDALPLALIFFAVVGSMTTGLATPTESAAVGAVASFAAALCYRLLTFEVVIASFRDALKFSAMILLIISCSATFSQILSFSGATQQLTSFFISELSLSPMMIVLSMLLFLLILGCFMESASIVMLTLPLFLPILTVLEVDLLWFAIMMMVALEIGLITPPFGMLLFVVQGVIGKSSGVSMREVYSAVTPFIIIQILILGFIFAFPPIVGLASLLDF